MRSRRAEFERLAEEALAGIPAAFRDLLYNLEIDVKAAPGPEAGRWRGSRDLLGLYTGLTREGMRSSSAGSHLPSRIVLYQRNIESRCADGAQLSRAIRTTLRHEIAHHFGFTDEDLRKKWPEGA